MSKDNEKSVQVEEKMIAAFSVWQCLIIIVSLGLISSAIIQTMKSRCRNSPIILIILLCGLIHELYAVFVLENLIHSAGENFVQYNSCADFYPVCFVAIAITLSTMSLSAVRTTFTAMKNTTLLRNLVLVYVALVLLLIIKLKISGYAGKTDHLPTMQFKSELLFVTVCERDVREDLKATITEYVGLFLPFLCLYLYVYRIQKKDRKEMPLSQLRCLPACQDGHVPLYCRKCIRLNPVLAIMFIYYLLSVIVVRPIFLLYSAVSLQDYRDLLPNITVTALCVFLAMYCTFNWNLVQNLPDTYMQSIPTSETPPDYSDPKGVTNADKKLKLEV